MYKTFVPAVGPLNAKIAIVGEQPGFEEIRSKPPKPFVGYAGKGLDECLIMAKISRKDIYLTNVIKDLDMPLKHYIDLDSRGKWTISSEGYQYINNLKEELKSLNLNIVVALGNIALIALTSRSGISKWRGSIIESTLVPGLKVIPTFHPATFIPPKFNFLNKPLICEDLIKARQEAEFKEIRRSERKIIIKPDFSFVCSYLEQVIEKGLRGYIISLDIEVINGELDCISISWSATECISIPFRYSQGDYFTPDQELQIMRLIASIIENEHIAKIGANFIFDLQFLFHKYGICPRGNLHCTQIAQKIIYPDFPAGLDFVTTMHTDVPYYKQDGKQWMKMGLGSWEEWWNYNGMDSLIPIEAHPKQMTLIKKQNNELTYECQRKLIEPLIFMSERGIKVDVEGMMKYSESQQIELDRLSSELNSEVGYEINYNSPKQLMDYFYKKLGFKAYKKKNTQGQFNESIDVDALKRLSRQNIKAAQIMLDIRSLTKRISTYLDIGKIDKDGRMRSSYKPVGAETGRISSGKTIFGLGGNQQNIPHDILRFFLFDDGYIGYSFDLSQIENRIVAYVGGVIEQIKAFENGMDLHRLSASIIFNKPYDQISDEDGSSDIGDGRHSERYWGKKTNHATNYDVGFKKFALTNEMSETEAKQVLEKIHRGYPQIRDGYQATIISMLKNNRTIVNLFGRSRLFLGPILPSYPFTPVSACADTYRQAFAHFAQSSCADKINKQGVEYIYYNQDLFKPIELLTQIHDSIVFQIPLSIPLIEHARMLLQIKQSLETPLTWHDRIIKTPVDLSIGFNLYKKEMIEIKSAKIPDSELELSNKLKDAYEELKQKFIQ